MSSSDKVFLAFCKACGEAERSWWLATLPIDWPRWPVCAMEPPPQRGETYGAVSPEAYQRYVPPWYTSSSLKRRYIDLLADGERVEILMGQEGLLLLRRLDLAAGMRRRSGSDKRMSNLPMLWELYQIDPLPVVWVAEWNVSCSAKEATIQEAKPPRGIRGDLWGVPGV